MADEVTAGAATEAEDTVDTEAAVDGAEDLWEEWAAWACSECWDEQKHAIRFDNHLQIRVLSLGIFLHVVQFN